VTTAKRINSKHSKDKTRAFCWNLKPNYCWVQFPEPLWINTQVTYDKTLRVISQAVYEMFYIKPKKRICEKYVKT